MREALEQALLAEPQPQLGERGGWCRRELAAPRREAADVSLADRVRLAAHHLAAQRRISTCVRDQGLAIALLDRGDVRSYTVESVEQRRGIICGYTDAQARERVADRVKLTEVLRSH